MDIDLTVKIKSRDANGIDNLKLCNVRVNRGETSRWAELAYHTTDSQTEIISRVVCLAWTMIADTFQTSPQQAEKGRLRLYELYSAVHAQLGGFDGEQKDEGPGDLS
ncbi:MAG: hypothetical protein Q3984_03545 [Eubacteriales bacterium]|nr:hypothetical protein [Eubacteriales bacterium]